MKYLLLVFALFVSPADAAIKRSYAAKMAFVRAQACPATGLHKLPCAGWVIDHVTPISCAKTPAELKHLDQPWNMQWQTIAEGKAKDRVERLGCAHG